MKFSAGKRAHGFCDRCGQRYKHLKIKKEWNGSWVCPSCFEEKHPQLSPPPVKIDAEALRNPHPQGDVDADIGDTDAQDYLDHVNARP